MNRTYKGLLTSLEENEIFVYGANIEGRHGAGSAKVAKEKFGAVYGKTGLQGQSWGIITKDLSKVNHPSIHRAYIIKQIKDVYEHAKGNPKNNYFIAYSGYGKNLNGYTPSEMASMFASTTIPANIIFEESFYKLVLRVYPNNICCFTGHRPNKLNGYNPKDNKKLLWELDSVINSHIIDKNVTTFISGMALGIDTWAAKIVLKYQKLYPFINLIAAVPCKNQESKWTEDSKIEYNKILSMCTEVVYVSEEYTKYCMQKRNEYMVDNSKYVIAVWDGSSGGTKNCVDYAKKLNKEIYYIKPQ